jgi:hypothetical protein
LGQIRSEFKHRRNIDIERFLELRTDLAEISMKVEKVEVSKGPVTFGIEVLSNGTKQFMDYDKVRLSAKTTFDTANLDPDIRTPNDNLYLAHYLYQNVKFFNFMNLTLIALL